MFRNPLASHRRAALLLAFCALCWSIAGVVTRHLERADSFEVTFWRSLFCAITVLSILAWQRRGHALAPLLEMGWPGSVSYTHLRAHETVLDLVCRLLLEKKKYITTLSKSSSSLTKS